jgi:hypothetical protein
VENGNRSFATSKPVNLTTSIKAVGFQVMPGGKPETGRVTSASPLGGEECVGLRVGARSPAMNTAVCLVARLHLDPMPYELHGENSGCSKPG